MAGKLDGQVAGKTARVLDQHHPHPMRFAVGQERGEAWPIGNRVRARDRGIIETVRWLIPALGITRDLFGLPALAVLVRADVCGAGSAIVGNGGEFLASHYPSPSMLYPASM